MSHQQVAIILEGPDGAGKSTLAKRLIDHFQISTLTHHGAYFGEARIAHRYLASLMPAWQRKVANQSYSVLLDRCWLAEPIYGKVMRGGADRISVWERRMLERTLLGIGGVVVLCLPSPISCHRAWQSRTDREYPDSRDKLYALWDAYFNAERDWLARGLAVVLYDYETDPSATRLCRKLSGVIERVANYGPGAGAWAAARWLLVGDRPNSEVEAGPQVPFVSMNETGCSAWLTRQLESWSVGEHLLHWVNQSDVYHTQFERLGGIDHLFDGRVVAMGKAAEGWCNANAIRFHTVPHPQHWKRFNFNDTYPLKEILT